MYVCVCIYKILNTDNNLECVYCFLNISNLMSFFFLNANNTYFCLMISSAEYNFYLTRYIYFSDRC